MIEQKPEEKKRRIYIHPFTQSKEDTKNHIRKVLQQRNLLKRVFSIVCDETKTSLFTSITVHEDDFEEALDALNSSTYDGKKLYVD